MQTLQFTRDPFSFLDRCSRHFGDTFVIHITWFGNGKPMLVTADPDLIKETFAEREGLLAGKGKEQLGRLLGGHSLFVLDGKEHRRHRRLLMPAFAHGSHLEKYGETMMQVAGETFERWPEQQEFDVVPSLRDLTTEVLIRCILGVDDAERVRRLASLTSRVLDSGGRPILMFPQVHRDWGRYSPWGHFLRIRQELYTVMDEEIAWRRATPGKDVLSLMVQARDEAGEPLSDAELRDELLSLLVGGTDTTATALSWTLCSLLPNRALCDHLTEEVRTARTGNSLNPRAVAQLKLLDATVREGLRLPPGAQLVARVAVKPVRIGNFDIPEGWQVSPCLYLAHLREPPFANPTEFIPQRFLDAPPSATQWLPFGGGAHVCIGQNFAIYQMKMVLALMLLRADIRLKRGFAPRPVRRAVTMAPRKVPLTVTRRR